MKTLIESSSLVISCGLEHRNCSVRIVQPTDVHENYVNSLNSPQITQHMGASKGFTHTFESTQDFIRAHLNSEKNYLFGLFLENTLVGTSRLHDIDWNGLFAWQGVLIFKNLQGKGFGSLLVKTVSDYVLQYCGISKIQAGILERNIISQKVFLKSGFHHFENDTTFDGRQIWIKEKNSV